MKLKQVDTILLVENIETSKYFYVDILKLEILYDWKTMLVFKDRLAIHQASELQPAELTSRFIQPGKQGRGNVVIYLESDDLEESFQTLKEAGVTFIHDIISLPWERIFRVLDPDGYVIEIGEPH
jgi:catechol 2,3-dioxygenase-like lactoylglutathione lyase family enzyme